MMEQKTFTIVVIVIIALLIVFAFVSYLSKGEIALEGKIICLPKKGTGPSTLECAYGINSDGGLNYALDISESMVSMANFPAGSKVVVTGKFTPDALGMWNSYDIENVIKVRKIEAVAAGISKNTISRGDIQFLVPDDFGLAVTSDQVLVKSYIPPCDENFDYCLYYNGTEFQGTNFESAGIRIKIRSDLKNQNLCLNTAPEGFENFTPKIANYAAYSAATFSPIQDAAAGHYSFGELYRLWVRNSCYEFQTRIGESQFANYPSGTITEFSSENRQNVRSKLQNVLKSIVITPDNMAVVFP